MTEVLLARGLRLERRGRVLIDDVSLALRAGEVVGLIGPNGAGKSTLLRLLAGLERSDAGSVALLGRPLPSWSARERAAALGYLPQHVSPHWDWRVSEMLRLGMERGGRGTTLGVLAEEFSLSGLLDRRWSTLSGGERARVLAAAVLAPGPPLILADEPAAAMDAGQSLTAMAQLSRRAAGGAAVAVVLHDLNLAAASCGRLVLMDGGRILRDGPSGEVLADPALDAAYRTGFRRIRPEGSTLIVVPLPVGAASSSGPPVG